MHAERSYTIVVEDALKRKLTKLILPNVVCSFSFIFIFIFIFNNDNLLHESISLRSIFYGFIHYTIYKGDDASQSCLA